MKILPVIFLLLAVTHAFGASRKAVTIHVVPIRNLQGNADFDYIAPTLTEAIYGKIRKQKSLKVAESGHQAQLALNSVYLQIGDTIEFRAQLKDAANNEISTINERARLNANLFNVVDSFVGKIEQAVTANLNVRTSDANSHQEQLMKIAFIPMENLRPAENAKFLSKLLSDILHDSLAGTFIFKKVEEQTPQPQLFSAALSTKEFKKLNQRLQADLIITGRFNIVLSEERLPETNITARLYDAKSDRLIDVIATDDESPGIFGTTDALAQLIRNFILQKYSKEEKTSSGTAQHRLVISAQNKAAYDLGIGIAFPLNYSLNAAETTIAESKNYPLRNDRGIAGLQFFVRTDKWLPHGFFWAATSFFRLSINHSEVHEYGAAVGTAEVISMNIDLGPAVGYQSRIKNQLNLSLQMGAGGSYQRFQTNGTLLVAGISPYVSLMPSVQYDLFQNLGVFFFTDARLYFYQQPEKMLAISIGLGTAYRL